MQQSLNSNRTYDKICIFCEKVSKYQESSKARDPLIKCCDLCADDSIRTRIISVLSCKIVADEARCHRSCYRDCTQPNKKGRASTSAKSKKGDGDDDNSSDIESRGYEKLFYFIWCDLLEIRLMTMIELQEMLFTLMCSMGATQLSESTKTNFQRKLEVEFGYLLQYKDLLDNSKLFIVPNNLSKLSLARDIAQLSQELKNKPVIWSPRNPKD